MYFVVSIDTEEDQWSDYFRKGHTFNNILALPRLQQLFEAYNIRPTYLLTYPVVGHPESSEFFREVVGRGVAEIGSHCHPWNTPPFEEVLSVSNSMLCNLPKGLQLQKIAELTSLIENRIGLRPVSFRAGRWGYSSEVAQSLLDLNYKVETSLTPFMNWQQFLGPDSSLSPLDPFFFYPESPMMATTIGFGSLFEVPVSIGFNRSNFEFCHWYSKFIITRKLSKKVFLGGMSRLGLMRKIWLSPEISTAGEMIKLIQILSNKKLSCLNMMFHSNSLFPGNTPFVKSGKELEAFYNKLEEVLEYVNSKQCKSITLSELRNEMI